VHTGGFVPDGAKTGVGIEVDCIRPIVIGTPQRQQATKPLPPVDPQIVSACKERNPNFGMMAGNRYSRLGRPDEDYLFVGDTAPSCLAKTDAATLPDQAKLAGE